MLLINGRRRTLEPAGWCRRQSSSTGADCKKGAEKALGCTGLPGRQV